MRVCVVVGTRPEAIKLAPVILALREEASVTCFVVSTGQHRDMCGQALAAFSIVPDHTLNTMQPGQSLGQLTSKLFSELDALFESEPPDWVIVQGDTTSAMVAATCAFYRKIPVGHVEAGLRTFDRWSPFPEEVNRTFISHVTTMHFAPTPRAGKNLADAGIPSSATVITGNTVVDAVRLLRPSICHLDLHKGIGAAAVAALSGRRLILVTSHRRESFGIGLENICNALLDLARMFNDLVIIYPVHLNPSVQEPVMRLLKGESRIHLLGSIPYLDLMALVERAHIVLTDSGGLQEEVPSFAKPILILREVTERPEAVECGAARLVGTDRRAIVAAASELLTDTAAYDKMARAGNPFGDGHAAARIVGRILDSSLAS